MKGLQGVVVAAVVAAVALFGMRVLFHEPQTATEPDARRAGATAGAVEGSAVASSGGGARGSARRDQAPAAGVTSPRARGARSQLQRDAHARSGAAVVAGADAGRSADGKALPPSGSRAGLDAGALGASASMRDQAVQSLAAGGAGAARDAGGEALVQDAAAGSDAEKAPREDGVMFSLPLTESVQSEDDQVPIAAEKIQLPEGGEDLRFTSETELAYPAYGNIQGEAGTIEFDLRPDWEGTDEANRSFVHVSTARGPTGNSLLVFKNGSFLRFLLFDSQGVETAIGVPISNWQPDEWHNVAATWGEAETRLYVDGTLVGQQTYSGEFQVAPGSKMFIGSDLQGVQGGAQATIQNFRVYDHPRDLGAANQ